MADKVLSPVIEGIVESPLGKEYPVFDGSTTHATIPVFTSASDPSLVQIITDTSNDDGYLIDATQPITEIGRVGANYHDGQPRSIRIIDPTPLQGIRAMGGGGSRAPKVSPISLPAGSMIEVYFQYVDNGGDQRFLGTQQYATPLSVTAIDALNFNSFAFAVALDGVPVDPVEITLVGGRHYHIQATLLEALFLTNLYESGAGAQPLAGAAAMQITSPDGRVYSYGNANDPGNKLRNTADPSGATDGVWYEGGVEMTDEEADAARDYYPIISRHYLLDTPGRIREVLGNTADATLVNLDASDWQTE